MPKEINHGYSDLTRYDLWNRYLTDHQEKKLAVAQGSMERSFLNVAEGQDPE